MRTPQKLLLISAAMLTLSACQSTGTQPNVNANSNLNSSVQRAILQASKGENMEHALPIIEREYSKTPENADIALPYAKALRHAGQLNRAAMILTPFARQKEATAGIYSEMAMTQLSLGDHNSAEKYAQKAVLQNPQDYMAYQTLGIALDAKDKHPEAERAFRKGLELWQGDKTVIMNNLALNLATQGFTDEAIQILEDAKKLSPDRIELERNLRIVRTMNER